jgi:CheY-like chemotaxis protein
MSKKTEPTIRLLLVDDEADFRLAASKALARQGFEIATAESGEQALERLAERAPDVMILDLKMEGMDGIATLAAARKTHPQLPVIILTGHGQYADALAGIRLAVVDFVQKPVDLKALGEQIRALLQRGAAPNLKEKTVVELMTLPERFHRVQADSPVRDLVQALFESVACEDCDDPIGQPRRAVLVFNRQERFLGIVRITDILRLMVPDFLRDSPYSSYFTGMFLAQSKTIGNRPIEDFIGQRATIDPACPLMEAIHMLVAGHQHDLPVVERGKLIGVLRGQEIFREIARSMLSLP